MKSVAKITPVILCGGSGTRLWPLSRADFPKQFLTLIGDKSLFQQTVLRLPETTFNPPICITSHDHRFIVADQLQEIKRQATIILEPESRNTAAAIAAAVTYHLQQQTHINQPSQQLLVLPADHYIEDNDCFWQALATAQLLANDKQLVTFGIKPQYAETGYGYINVGNNAGEQQSQASQGFKVLAFSEKPDKKTATSYLNSGQHFWNSGMFLFAVDTIQAELQQHCPLILEKAQQAMETAQENLAFIELGPAFIEAPNISIDYAVMEKSHHVSCVTLNCRWSDVGSFKSLADLSKTDNHGNTLKGDAINLAGNNNYISAEANRVVATIGVNDAANYRY